MAFIDYYGHKRDRYFRYKERHAGRETNPSLLVMLADISALSVPEVRWKKSDSPFGDDGPLLDTNEGGPLQSMPAKHYITLHW